jgi:uncharacterized protein (TIRG00374 family)
MRALFKNALIATIAIIIIVIVSTLFDLKGTLMSLARTNPVYLLFDVAAFVLSVTLKMLPWTYLIRKTKLKLGFFYNLLLLYSFLGFQAIPTGMGGIVPLRYLEKFRKNSSLFSPGIALSLILTGFVGLAILALVTSIIISSYVVYTITILAVTYIISSLFGSNLFLSRLFSLFKHTKVGFLKNVKKYTQTLIKTRAFLSQKDIIIETFLFLPSLITESAIMYFTLLAFGHGLLFVDVLFIFAISNIIGSMSLAPMGLGAMDLSSIALLLLYGVPGIVAASTMVIFRFFNFILLIFLGYGAFSILENLKPERLDFVSEGGKSPLLNKKGGGPLISVVIPTFNEGKYLGNMLKSLKDQTYKNYEIIVADGDSKDNTRDIARKYGCRVINVRKRGISLGKNEGMKLAKGKIVGFLDADLVLPPTLFKAVVNTFIRNGKVVGVQPVHAIDKKEIPKKALLRMRFLCWFINTNTKFSFAIGKAAASACVFVRADALKKAGDFLEHLDVLEDLNLYSKIAKYGKFKTTKPAVRISYRRFLKNGAFSTMLIYARHMFHALASKKVKQAYEPVR